MNMHEGLPIKSDNEVKDIITNQTNESIEVDAKEVERVYGAVRKYATEEGVEISDESLRTAAFVLVQRAAERGETLDLSTLPFKDIITSRQEIEKTGVPVVDRVTGEVIASVGSEKEARERIIEHNKGVNQEM